MCRIGAKSNIPEKRDINSKDLKEKLGIEKITEIPNTREGKEIEDIEDNSPGGGKDRILFQAGPKGKLFLAEGVKMDMDAFSDLYNDDKHPMTFQGKEIGVGYVYDNKMELNSKTGKRSFDIEGIKELTVPVEEAIEKLHKDGIDQVIFRADGKNYIAYGKDMFFENLDTISNQNLLAGDPILFNGKEINIIYSNDEATSFKEGFSQTLEKTQGVTATIVVAAAAVGAATAGPMGLAVYPVVAAATTMAVAGTIGGIKGALNNKQHPENMNSITKEIQTAPANAAPPNNVNTPNVIDIN